MSNEVKGQSLALQGMRAIITGGAQGIGASICLELALEGATVVVVDIQEDKSKELVKKIVKLGQSAIAIHEDIRSKEACQQLINNTIDKLGGLDILVNCASPMRDKTKMTSVSDSDWDIHQSLVLDSAAILSDAASKHLKASGRGTIVNVSSILGESIGTEISWPYHVSKAGLNHLTRWLAVRFGSEGIRVNAVSPGLLDRDEGPKLSDNLEDLALVKEVVPLRRPAKSKEIAQVVVFLCSEKSSYITGQIITVDGGLNLKTGFDQAKAIINWTKK
jgi:NAD(P)-dependent dehydrogenase (short-subunit alcohol dehydrogenase family)